jgi:hypothetical protein
MDEEKRMQTQDLLRAHQSRLHMLELQSAQLGIGTPPQIMTEMQQIRAEIGRINADLATTTLTTTTPTALSLLEDFPSSLKSDFAAAEEVWLVGASLVRTIRPDYHVMTEKLKKRHIVRVLVVHPTDTLIEPSVQRSFKPTSIERKRSEITDTLQVLCELQQQTSDKLQIRTIQYPLGYGAHVLNPGKTSGALYIKLYPYKLPMWKPKFVLYANQGSWYEYYLKELHMLWDNGTNWNCEQNV